jgi:transcriptional regulator with XRE-family HTH domain
MEEQAKELRAQGLTYQAIADRLGVNVAKAWTFCNRERQRQNTNESRQRWVERGCEPLWQGEET